MSKYIRFFSDLSNEDTAEVGGKNASLGEMISQLGPKGIRTPASDIPEFTQFLVEQGINSISFNPDAVAKGIRNILEAEKKGRR